MNPMLLGLVRHVLTMAGAGLVTAGYLDEASMQTAVGAVVALIGVAWSAIDKRGR